MSMHTCLYIHVYTYMYIHTYIHSIVWLELFLPVDSGRAQDMVQFLVDARAELEPWPGEEGQTGGGGAADFEEIIYVCIYRYVHIITYTYFLQYRYM